MLKVENLNFDYGKSSGRIIDISFEAPKSKITLFIGSNGSGKTTTIKSLLGILDKGKTGKVFINNELYSETNLKKRISFTPAQGDSFSFERAKSHVMNYLILFGLKRKDASKRMVELFEYFGILHLKSRMLKSLSDGQRKLISLIKGLAIEADVYIFDEPTTYIDILHRNSFFKKIEELKKQGKTIIISSHEIKEMQRHSDNIIFINNGKILFSGKKKDFISAFGKDIKTSLAKAVRNV